MVGLLFLASTWRWDGNGRGGGADGRTGDHAAGKLLDATGGRAFGRWRGGFGDEGGAVFEQWIDGGLGDLKGDAGEGFFLGEFLGEAFLPLCEGGVAGFGVLGFFAFGFLALFGDLGGDFHGEEKIGGGDRGSCDRLGG